MPEEATGSRSVALTDGPWVDVDAGGGSVTLTDTSTGDIAGEIDSEDAADEEVATGADVIGIVNMGGGSPLAELPLVPGTTLAMLLVLEVAMGCTVAMGVTKLVLHVTDVTGAREIVGAADKRAGNDGPSEVVVLEGVVNWNEVDGAALDMLGCTTTIAGTAELVPTVD